MVFTVLWRALLAATTEMPANRSTTKIIWTLNMAHKFLRVWRFLKKVWQTHTRTFDTGKCVGVPAMLHIETGGIPAAFIPSWRRGWCANVITFLTEFLRTETVPICTKSYQITPTQAHTGRCVGENVFSWDLHSFRH